MTMLIANSIEEVLHALASGARPIAGGSDLVVAARHGKAALPSALVAIDRIAALKSITETSTGLHIGAGVNHATLMEHPLIVAGYTALADASALVGSPATRHVGTLGGNVMNASPAMDTGAPLVVLGASVTLHSSAATRSLPVSELWSGPGRTVANDNELCTAITLPTRPARSGSAYIRLEYRRAMEIAVVGTAAALSLNDDGSIAELRVALTAVAPTIIEVVDLHNTVGMAPTLAAAIASQHAREQATPISDLRASDRYRRHSVGVMALRAVLAAARRASGESISVPVNRSGAFE